MPRRTGRIRVRAVGPLHKAERTVYLGEERRKNSKDRRVVPDRREVPADFLKSIVLGRRHAGMSDAEIANARAGNSGRRKTFFGSQIESAMPYEFGVPVQQTTRRASTTRRLGLPRRWENSGTHKQIDVEWKLNSGATVFIAKHRHKQVGSTARRRKRSFGPVEDEA